MRIATIIWREAPGLAVVVLAAILYWIHVPAWVLGGDNGEFSLLATAAGIAHPPGYPLLTGLLRLMASLPAATPAQSAGYATALMAVGQLIVLYVAARLWALPPFAAALSLAVYATSSLSLQYFMHAEVFALNGLIVAAIIALCAASLQGRPFFVALSLGLFSGLGFSHHHSFILLAPLIICAFISVFRRLDRSRSLRALGLAALGLGLGLVPNLLLLPWSQDEHAFFYSWAVIDDLPGLLHHFLRRDYGTFDLAHESGKSTGLDWGLNLRYLAHSLLDSWRLLLPLAMVGFASRLRHRCDGIWWRWFALLLSFVLAGPVFLGRANIDPQSVVGAADVLERFFLLPALLLVLPVAEGIRFLVDLLRSASLRLQRNKRLPAWMSEAFLLLLVIYCFLVNSFLSLRATAVKRGPSVQQHLENIFGIAPSGSIVIIRSDDEVFAGAYLQEVLGYRRDLSLVKMSYIKRPLFQRRLANRLSDCRLDLVTLKSFFESVNASCRKPFLLALPYADTEPSKRLLRDFPNYQYGPFRRVMPPGTALPSPQQVMAINKRLFASFARPERPVSLAHGWASRPALIYYYGWLAIARDMTRAGRRDLAREAVQLASLYGPCFRGSCLQD